MHAYLAARKKLEKKQESTIIMYEKLKNTDDLWNTKICLFLKDM